MVEPTIVEYPPPNADRRSPGLETGELCSDLSNFALPDGNPADRAAILVEDDGLTDPLKF